MSERNDEWLPLRGVRVVAVEQAVAAPLATRHLADLGADIIKIERPDGGDFARDYDSVVDGVSSWFVWVGRGKRSLTLDLKSPTAIDIVHKLLADADVFVQNLGPGAAERLGLGAEDLRPLYPRLVVCNITGYGPDGPFRDRKAYDLLLQGEGGILAVTGNPEQQAKVGVSIADISAGMYAFSAITAALYERNTTGEGTTLDIALLDSIAEWASAPLYFTHYAGTAPSRAGVRHASIVPYGQYATSDGAVNLAIQNEREWTRFCEMVLEDPAVGVDERYAGNAKRLANRVELEAEIERRFAVWTTGEVERRLDKASIAFGRVNDLNGVWTHQQLRARGRYSSTHTASGDVEVLNHPMMARGKTIVPRPVPGLGEQTDDILAEVGFSLESIANLRRDGVV